MSEPTNAQLERRLRWVDRAWHATRTCASLLAAMRKHLGEATRQFQAGSAAQGEVLVEKVSEAARAAAGSLLHVEVPGMEAKDLVVREHPGIFHAAEAPSVFELAHFAWWCPRSGAALKARLQEQSQRAQVAEEAGLFVSKSRGATLSSRGILARLAAAGWDDDRIAGYVGKLLEVTEDKGTITQRAEVTKLVQAVLQHTEPKQLFELPVDDLEGLSDEELARVERRAAQAVANEIALLQQEKGYAFPHGPGSAQGAEDPASPGDGDRGDDAVELPDQ